MAIHWQDVGDTELVRARPQQKAVAATDTPVLTQGR